MPRNASGIPLAVILSLAGPIKRPVDLVRLLVRNGMSLRKAHATLNRLAEGATVPTELPRVADADAVLTELRQLGIEGSRREPPQIDAKAIREQQDLTQQEFAVKYGLEVATVRNWEQDRTRLSGPARILLGVIARHPEAVEDVLKGP